MREVVKAGRSLEEAVEAALAELGLAREQVDVEVLEEDEGRGGLLSLLRGTRQVKVRVTERVDRARAAAEFVRHVGDLLELPLKVVAVEEDEAVRLEVEGEDLGVLIGRRGQTLGAVEFLANLVAARVAGAGKRIVVDVGGYRRRRGEQLERLARAMAERAVRTGREVVLRPMSARERRIVHVALAQHPGVQTSSRGEEPNRQVVIAPVRGWGRAAGGS